MERERETWTAELHHCSSNPNSSALVLFFCVLMLANIARAHSLSVSRGSVPTLGSWFKRAALLSFVQSLDYT